MEASHLHALKELEGWSLCCWSTLLERQREVKFPARLSACPLTDISKGLRCGTGLRNRDQCKSLIKEAATALGPAVAWQLAACILDRELVVIGELLAAKDAPQGKNDNVLLALHVDDARVAVGLAGVVDETGGVAVHCGIHHVKVIDAEHVAPNALQALRGERDESEIIWGLLSPFLNYNLLTIHQPHSAFNQRVGE